MTRLVRRMLRTTFYAAGAVVGVLSLSPGAALPACSIGDKAEHVMAYALLGLIGSASSERGVMRIAVGLAAFGAVIELLQAFSPGRSPDPIDAMADVIGASIGCGVVFAVQRAMRQPRQGRSRMTSVRCVADGRDASEPTDMLFDIPSRQPQGPERSERPVNQPSQGDVQT